MEIKNRKTDAVLPLVIALVLVAGILIGVNFRNSTASAGNDRKLLLFASSGKLTQAFELITGSYVDSVSAGVLEEDAIKGMLKHLDPHSQYIPASELAAINEPLDGNFSGIGIQFNMLNDTVVVVNTVPKGPSEKAGIMAGDRMVRVNDSLVAGMKMPSKDIVKMLKGKTGTVVKVGMYRKGNDGLLDFTVTRDRIPLLSVDVSYMVTAETGYIKVSKFSRTTLQEFTEALDQLKTQGLKKLIVDLRDNPGGIIDGAIGMSELFLPQGQLIVYTAGGERSRTNYYSRGRYGQYADIELALLINETAASASEIVAGAIQDNDRGIIIGRRSFGKGLVQEQHSFSDGSAIRLTVARYYTPTGRCIQKPYNRHDSDEYYNELNERYRHGELLIEDSIRFNDSLRFVTRSGKVVYGGGGIMPDIFVPIDTSNYSGYYAQIMRNGLINRFAFDYADKNRKKLSAAVNYQDLEKEMINENILKEFIRYAAEQGIAHNDRDLKTSGATVENVVIACIARNIFDDSGFYPILNRNDKMVQRGIEALEDKDGKE